MPINPKFILRDPNSKKETSIKFYFYLDKKRLTYSLGPDRMIHPELWDSKNMRPISNSLVKNRDTIKKLKKFNRNIELDIQNIESRIENIIRDTKKYINGKELYNEKTT